MTTGGPVAVCLRDVGMTKVVRLTVKTEEGRRALERLFGWPEGSMDNPALPVNLANRDAGLLKYLRKIKGKIE